MLGGVRREPASLPARAFSPMEDQGAQQHPPARLSNGGQADEPAEVRPLSARVAVCALPAATWWDKAAAAP